MNFANYMSVLKGWGGYAAAALERVNAPGRMSSVSAYGASAGSVMALLLWLYRRRKNGVGFGRMAAAFGR